ncbi:MAG: hypothetical protein DCC88_04205 [Spirobacillus cienkowskii]|jgi:hypothetical protein|uniref:Uncharacterized protein n=1 Tax=Spirobacillus cienkowskii TaxID=495820 RepID=A0A369KZK8_9BACT|nr:MAG: hypothetical protein DCC88_04205 [Spirobacillus cienkowskii]
MNANLILNFFFNSFIGISILCLGSIYLTGRISFLISSTFNYLHWHYLIFPFNLNIINYFLTLLRGTVDKLPFLSLSFVVVEKFNLSMYSIAILIFFTGILKLISPYEWSTNSPKIKKWRFEHGCFQNYNNSNMTNNKKNIELLLVKLAKQTNLNKFEIAKSDFRCYFALSFLFLSTQLSLQNFSFSILSLFTFFLIFWCIIDAFGWNRLLRHKNFNHFETFQENPIQFFLKFFNKIILLIFVNFIFFIALNNKIIKFDNFIIGYLILIFVFFNKITRIYNEFLLAKLNLQKEYYPANSYKDQFFKFENARVWRDIGAQSTESINPLLRLVMFKTMFALSERRILNSLIAHFDFIIGSYLYIILLLNY